MQKYRFSEDFSGFSVLSVVNKKAGRRQGPVGLLHHLCAVARSGHNRVLGRDPLGEQEQGLGGGWIDGG